MADSVEEKNKDPEKSCLTNLDDKIQLLKKKLQEKENTIQEKEKTIQEKDRTIQEKDKTIQEKENTIQEKENAIQEKDKIIQEKENTVQEKDKIIQEKDKTVQGKDKTIQEKDNTTQEKDKEIQRKNNIIQEKDDKIQEKDNIIQEKDKIIQKKDNKIQEKDKIIQEKDEIIQEKDKIIQEKDSKFQEKNNKIQELVNNIQEKDNKIRELVNNVQEKDKKIEKNKIQKIVEEKDNKIQEKDKEIQELEQDNYKLKKEAADYQYALGAATSFRLSDDDKNNSVKFKEDIIYLRHSLENYITKCKGNSVEINIPEVQNLLKIYGSQTDITKDQKKPLIRAVIQRHVIEQILKYAKGYFDDFTQPKFMGGMESFMHRRANELIEVAEAFARKRDGIDDTTKAFPTKLRQQIFAALGNRGFNNVINNNKNFLHDFIKKYQSVLNKEINKYRKLKDFEKKQEIEDMAGDIIRKVVTLFWFRLKVQEPIAEYIWFNYKDKIDPSCMEGIWDDDVIDNIVVDICHFPLIANKSTDQIYTPAKVFHEEIIKIVSSEK
ncbi:hypothetical protein RhiirA5_493144 [Rhizophagus irregularis]|uniref:Microtubule-associated protein 1a n=1 Tax=Rhizophagus irregularis TaxID=588596 RepID=A0A2N0QDW2_9GLOM|nr:hypothetical protein RhiirA5_493144 [Rhizophagus irregularis]